MRLPQITVLGECVADAFTVPAPAPDELTLRVLPGGGPANTAVALARLGTPARLLARLSDDVFGRLFRARLESSGVDLSQAVRAGEPSTLAVAELDAAGQAAYSFHAQGTADFQWTADELAATDLASTACLHSGSLALVREPGGRAVEEFLARASATATISLDPNVRPLLVAPEVYRERLPRWCALADVLRVSEDDLELLLPGHPIDRACDVWHSAGARLVVVTLGGRGAIASLDGETGHGRGAADRRRRHRRGRRLLHRGPAPPPRGQGAARWPADGSAHRRRHPGVCVRGQGRGSHLLGQRPEPAVGA
jgi:fructokinase